MWWNDYLRNPFIMDMKGWFEFNLANEFHLLQLLQIIVVQDLRICIARKIEETTYKNVIIKINLFCIKYLWNIFITHIDYYKLFFN